MIKTNKLMIDLFFLNFKRLNQLARLFTLFSLCFFLTVACNQQQSSAHLYQNQPSSDRLQELIDQQRLEADAEKRQEIFREIQQILVEDISYIPLWQTKKYAFAQNNINGRTINLSHMVLRIKVRTLNKA